MPSPRFDTWTVWGKTTLHVDSTRIDECMSYFRREKLDSLTINYIRGYALRDLEFLRDHPYVERLKLVHPHGGFDVGGLSALRDLKELVTSDPIAISPEDHPRLEHLRGDWIADIDYSAFPELRTLALWKFAPKCKDVHGLRAVASLRHLELTQPRIASLAGLERFDELRHLGLAYLRTATDFRSIGRLVHLERLELTNCPKIQSYGFLSNLARLAWLNIDKCADLHGVGFVRDMPLLEHFSFYGTTAIDGDLSPLLGLPHVFFTSKRQYSHTLEQIEKLLADRH